MPNPAPSVHVGVNGIDWCAKGTGACRGWSVGPVIKPTKQELPTSHRSELRLNRSPRNRRGHGNGSSDATVADSRKALLTNRERPIGFGSTEPVQVCW